MVAYMVSLTISCQLAALLLLLVLGACEFSSFDSDNEVVIAPALVSIAQDQVTGSGNGKRCFTTAAVACPARPHPSPFPCPLSAYRLQPASVGGVMTARYATDDAAAVRDEHASTVAVEDSTLLSGRSSGYGPAENWNEQQEEHQQKRHLHNSPSPSHPVDRPGRPASGSMLLWRCWLAALVLTSISPGVLR